eukprot:TRINITY_DN4095_c0_g1_i1.p1 TRINITY_DN4095_c0_g1~~TRINITY_DN4095_c0_g1_i1.p1  ORF type:complete len:247 (+),score=61.78 TRINITY_DN4095_c0_g1_i1:70-810(+)
MSTKPLIPAEEPQAEASFSEDEENEDYKDFEHKLSQLKALKPIKLNVGGKIFETSKATLTKERSLFSALIAKFPSEEVFFLDRDPKYFEWILNYLRTGSFRIRDNLLGFEKFDLIEELEYYQVESLLDLLKPERKKHKIIKKRKRIKKPIKFKFAKTANTVKIRVLYPPRKDVHRQIFLMDRDMTLSDLTELLSTYTENNERPKIIVGGKVWEEGTKVLGDVVQEPNFICMKTVQTRKEGNLKKKA